MSTVSDKRHCYLHEVVANECGIVDNDRLDENGYYVYVKNDDGKKKKEFITKYYRMNPDNGPVGIVDLSPSEVFVTMFAATLEGEPGPRVYAVEPGDCSADCPPSFKELIGFYKLSVGANRVAAIASYSRSDTRLLVHEHSADFPSSKTFPFDMPADKLCIVDLETKNPDSVLIDRKICVLNYLHIPDPYNTADTGLGFYPLSQKKVAGLEVINDNCVLIGTDTGYPLSNNDYGLDLEVDSVPFFIQAVEDTRFLFVCFFEPIFHRAYPFTDFGL